MKIGLRRLCRPRSRTTIAPHATDAARLAPILHLTRVTTAFAAIANAWFVIL